jgi:hypothetical protein
MTYAEDFLENRYAQIATTIGHGYRKDAEWMHRTAHELYRLNAERLETKGKPMSSDHLKQEAVKRAK